MYNNNPYNNINTYNPYYNNYLNYNNQRQQVIRVNGQNGAKAYQLNPNSSILLLDETAPIIWLKTTDGAGYATVTAYDIAPHQNEIPVDTKSLEARVTRLEQIMNERVQNLEEKINEQSKSDVKSVRKGGGSAEQSKSNQAIF